MKILKNITTTTMVMVVLLASSLEARETKKVSNFSSESNFVDSSGTFDGNRIYADVTNNGLFLEPL
jgi:hypothetical protein